MYFNYLYFIVFYKDSPIIAHSGRFTEPKIVKILLELGTVRTILTGFSWFEICRVYCTRPSMFCTRFNTFCTRPSTSYVLYTRINALLIVGNIAILTHDFVHRTHVDIFGFYYPRVFTDWFADDWITGISNLVKLYWLNYVVILY